MSRSGHTYTPTKTVDAEKKIAASYDGPTFIGPITVNLVFDTDGTAVIIEPANVTERSKLRGDLDNYIKTVLDALNGVAWEDDRQVVKIVGVKL